MPPKLGAALRCRRPRRRLGIAAVCALTLAAGAAAARAQPLAPPGAMLDRLCAQSLRSNEEDRLFGMISITVRATIKYHGAVSSPDLIDESVQNGLAAIIDACPQIAAADPTQRLGMAVALISDATARRLVDGNPRDRRRFVRGIVGAGDRRLARRIAGPRARPRGLSLCLGPDRHRDGGRARPDAGGAHRRLPRGENRSVAVFPPAMDRTA